MRTYFITADIHSFFTIFHNELLKQGFDINDPEHHIIICGDAFDRGDESKELLDFLYNLYERERLVMIRGNHDDLFQDMILFGHRTRDISNGTLKTLAHLQLPSPISEKECALKFVETRNKYDKRFNELLSSMVDYFELGDYIFVHGWLPVIHSVSDDNWWDKRNNFYDPDWRNASISRWRDSRWLNGMDEWKNGIREKGKTIVCGHWHCSYGWSHIDMKYKEFPQKSSKKFLESFKTWRKESEDGNIIALDACTVYSNSINILKLTEEDLYEEKDQSVNT